MRKTPILLICGLAAAIPAAGALAGKATTSGDQSLQISASLTPNKPGTKAKPRGAVFKLHIDYKSLNENAQIKENTKAVILNTPKGMKLHPSSAPVCKFSDMVKQDANGQQAGEAACPAGSQVGTGTATADARPAIPDPLPATVKLFNGLDDVNLDGTPRDPGIPAVILFAKTSIGVTSTLPFDILSNKLQLDFPAPQPGQAQIYHIQTVDISLPNRGGSKAYVTVPNTCPKSRKWRFSMDITNYDGPTAAATHDVRCRKR